VLGAVASATERVGLMTYVTCPIMRYHSAVVAQKAATVALLAGGLRFTLGLGAGENLNGHVVGRGWPPANVRDVMLSEAIEIIRCLFDEEYVSLDGEHFPVDSANLWDKPADGVPIAVAVSGTQSIERFAPVADAMVALEPEPSLVLGFDGAAGAALPKIGQQPLAWGPDADEAVARAHEQFRWFAGGMEGQRGAARDGGVRRGDPVRPSGGRRGGDPVRTGRRGAGGSRAAVRQGRVHPHRVGADRRADPGGVHRSRRA